MFNIERLKKCYNKFSWKCSTTLMKNLLNAFKIHKKSLCYFFYSKANKKKQWKTCVFIKKSSEPTDQKKMWITSNEILIIYFFNLCLIHKTKLQKSIVNNDFKTKITI